MQRYIIRPDIKYMIGGRTNVTLDMTGTSGEKPQTLRKLQGQSDACVELVSSLTRVRWETEDRLVTNELCVMVSDLTNLDVFEALSPPGSSVKESHTCSTALAIVIRSFELWPRSWRIKSLPITYRQKGQKTNILHLYLPASLTPRASSSLSLISTSSA